MLLRVLIALLSVAIASAGPTFYAPDTSFNCVTPPASNPSAVCFCGGSNSWSMKPIDPTYAVPDMNYSDTVAAPNTGKVSFQASVLRYGATPGVPQSTFGGGPWLHHDTTKPCYWTSSTGALTCSFRLRLFPSASSTLVGSATITSSNLLAQSTPFSSYGIATSKNADFTLQGNLTLTTTLVSNALSLATSAGYPVNDRLIFAQLANPVNIYIRRAWEYPGLRNNAPDMRTTSPDPAFLWANRVSQSFTRWKSPSADPSWRMALWGADSVSSTKVAIDLYFTMLTCDGTPPTPNGGSTPEEVCLDVTPQVKKYCPPAQTSTEVASNTNGVALSFTSVGC